MVFALGSSVGDDVKWQSAIDRALGTWESVVEWADYISFLSRVQKAIKNKHRCEGSNLPLSSQISEMLARCLEPTLPAGVHQTCIDVYDTVFTILGPEKLSETINIWLPGLLPVVSWAAFNVKPLIVDLFTKHIVPAVSSHPQELRELYRPILLSLLQSIEAESSDCYSEICDLLGTLNSLSDNSGDSLFWQCYYLCILTSPDSRLGALTYLQKNQPDTKQAALFIRAVCSGLEDQNVLVQRGFLDVLTKYLPLDSAELQDNKSDFRKLMLSACRTIFRKDMSLNRRLRLWLLGPEPETINTDGDHDNMTRLEYLRKYAADTLIDFLLEELENDISATCVIAQGLMDRWEVGVTIAPALLTPVLNHVYEKGIVEPPVASFFDNIESNIVWNTVVELLHSHPETVLFMVQNFNIKDEDMLNLYIPLAILYILADDELTSVKSDLVQKLVTVLPPQEIPEAPKEPLDRAGLRDYIYKLFKDSLEANISGENISESSVLSKKHISWYLLKLAGDVVLTKNSGSILNKVLGLFPETPGLEVNIPQCTELIGRLSATSSDGVELFIHIVSRMTPEQIRHYIKQFSDHLAESLISNSNRQLELVRELWKLNDATDGYVVPSAISTILANKSMLPFHRAKVFSGIWVHSIDQSDVSIMLTKPLLLFMDIESEDKSLFYAYLQSSVVRTGTAPRMVKLLVDKLDLESRGDDFVFSYVLERFVAVLNNPEIRTAYVTKYAPLVCTLLLEWFDKSLLPEKAYAYVLELAELTILDSRIKDGKVWLRRFVDALTHSYIKEHRADNQEPVSEGSQGEPKEKIDENIYSNNESSQYPPTENVAPPIPVALIKFVTAAIPNLEHMSDIRIFIEVCVNRLKSDVDYEVFNQLLISLLTSDPAVEDALLKRIVSKLSSLDEPFMNSGAGDLGDNRGTLHLIAAIESILATGLEVVRKGASNNSNSGGGLTSAITGFQVESPEDRSRAEASQATVLSCLQMAVGQCCKYWLFLQRTRFSTGNGDLTTALHTTGRLKTRLRKLMSLCYASRPSETLQAVGANIHDMKLAVKMTHMFEGARVGPTLEQLLGMAAAQDDPMMFDFAATYVASLETDVLGDVWPILHQYLVTVTSSLSSYSSPFSGSLSSLSIHSGNNSSSGSGSKGDGNKHNYGQLGVLAFLTRSVIPRFEQLRLKNRKKFARDFADIYSKLLLNDTSDLQVVSTAVQQMSIVVTEPDRQASLLGRILNSLLKSPQDIAKGADFLNVVSNTFGIAGTSTAKAWTRHVGDFIFETRTEKDLMPMDLEQSIKLRPVIKTWVQCDKERVKDFISKLSTYGSSTGVLFGWSGTQELANSNLRRLAYLTVCTPPTILGVNWSKLTNQLANMWTQNAAAVCLLLRACILGQPSTTIVAFMAYRLQSIFSDILKKQSVVEGEEADLLVEACKLVDLALVLGSEQFQPFEWLFISDNGNTVYNFVGQADHVEKAQEKPLSEVDNSDEKKKHTKSKGAQIHNRAGAILERLVGCPAIPKTAVSEQLVAPAPTYKGKRRPLLPQRATLADLPMFLSQVSLASHEEVYSMTVPDRDYCEEWLLADLFH